MIKLSVDVQQTIFSYLDISTVMILKSKHKLRATTKECLEFYQFQNGNNIDVKIYTHDQRLLKRDGTTKKYKEYEDCPAYVKISQNLKECYEQSKHVSELNWSLLKNTIKHFKIDVVRNIWMPILNQEIIKQCSECMMIKNIPSATQFGKREDAAQWVKFDDDHTECLKCAIKNQHVKEMFLHNEFVACLMYPKKIIYKLMEYSFDYMTPEDIVRIPEIVKWYRQKK